MIIEIEYYKNDTKICGGNIDFSELDKSIKQTERLCDIKEDNFVRILCDMIRFEKIETDELPDLVYDRDTKKFYRPHF